MAGRRASNPNETRTRHSQQQLVQQNLMGLAFRQSNAQWSYSGFNAFRCRLAAEIGINLREMAGFGPPERPWHKITDGISPLLNHSDCEGELTPEECKRVAPRLRELVADWTDGHDKQNALELADDMEATAEKGEALVFC